MNVSKIFNKPASSRTHVSLSHAKGILLQRSPFGMRRDWWDLLVVFIAIYFRYLDFKNTSIARAIEVFLKSNYRKYLSPKISRIIPIGTGMSYYLNWYQYMINQQVCSFYLPVKISLNNSLIFNWVSPLFTKNTKHNTIIL